MQFVIVLPGIEDFGQLLWCVKYCHTCCEYLGGQEVMLFCEKVTMDDIELCFFHGKFLCIFVR